MTILLYFFKITENEEKLKSLFDKDSETSGSVRQRYHCLEIWTYIFTNLKRKMKTTWTWGSVSDSQRKVMEAGLGQFFLLNFFFQ